MTDDVKKVGLLYREALIKHIEEGIKKRNQTFLISYTNVSGQQMNRLRKDLKGAGANLFASKNSLAVMALKNIKQDDFASSIEGQTAFVWSDAESVDISKILVKFAEECKGVIVRGGLLDGDLLKQADIERLASLPPREVLLSQLLQVIQSPLTRLAYTLNAKTRDLLSILKQLGDKKGGQ